MADPSEGGPPPSPPLRANTMGSLPMASKLRTAVKTTVAANRIKNDMYEKNMKWEEEKREKLSNVISKFGFRGYIDRKGSALPFWVGEPLNEPKVKQEEANDFFKRQVDWWVAQKNKRIAEREAQERRKEEERKAWQAMIKSRRLENEVRYEMIKRNAMKHRQRSRRSSLMENDSEEDDSDEYFTDDSERPSRKSRRSSTATAQDAKKTSWKDSHTSKEESADAPSKKKGKKASKGMTSRKGGVKGTRRKAGAVKETPESERQHSRLGTVFQKFAIGKRFISTVESQAEDRRIQDLIATLPRLEAAVEILQKAGDVDSQQRLNNIELAKAYILWQISAGSSYEFLERQNIISSRVYSDVRWIPHDLTVPIDEVLESVVSVGEDGVVRYDVTTDHLLEMVESVRTVDYRVRYADRKKFNGFSHQGINNVTAPRTLINQRAYGQVNRAISMRDTFLVDEIKNSASQFCVTIINYTLMPLGNDRQVLMVWVIRPDGHIHHTSRVLDKIRGDRTLGDTILQANVEISGVKLPPNRARRKGLRPRDMNPSDMWQQPNWQQDAKNPEEGGIKYVAGEVDLDNIPTKPFLDKFDGIRYNRKMTQTPKEFDTGDFSLEGVQLLQDLFDVLIRPLEEFLPKSSKYPVVIVPHRELFKVPWNALVSSVGLKSGRCRYLIDDFPLIFSPSIQNFDYKMQRRRLKNGLVELLGEEKQERKAAIVGVPSGDSDTMQRHRLQQMESVPRECRVFEQILTDTYGEFAPLNSKTKTVPILKNISESHVAMVSGHVVMDEPDEIKKNQMNPLVQQSSVLTAFKHAKEEKDLLRREAGFLTSDGILDEEIWKQLMLPHDPYIFLNSSNSGFLSVLESEGPLSIVRGLLVSGASGVLVNMFRCEDGNEYCRSFSGLLAIELYRALFPAAAFVHSSRRLLIHEEREEDDEKAFHPLNVAVNVRKALLKMKEVNEHPASWAGFMLYGGCHAPVPMYQDQTDCLVQ